ncbi:rod shape-determining protein RodA [Desulfuribacillus stibiiarsenatis]|uniref:Peptidoglycan glycosyltransferase RodA n=1 Tax=Desulfuribacillus stibiiarsenatis TaxID=1390249 RepID=A0A1E5L300_9FIRM|nr:rod shape-determining protein RodA [Desulfuribacillus stibiiarsenatis]OEH84477.1 rod shape-determining protein RodA [Desulfuribacillus stibiiarsenatis]
MSYKWLLEKNWKNLDMFLLLLLFAFALFSVTIINSATGSDAEEGLSFYAKRQLLWIVIATILMAVVAITDHRVFEQYALPLYIIGVLLLLYVEVQGFATKGSQRWIDLGFFRMQPSEFVKICVILMLAKELSKFEGEIYRFRDLIRSFVIVGVPFLLLIMEPDLGTSLVLIGIMICMFLIAGVNWRVFLILFIIAALFIGMLVFFYYVNEELFFKFIKPYQLSRITSFMNPEGDPLQSGFQVTQSLIAVGSGQLTGKGLSSGSQTQGGWIPEHHTDFIFAVVGEELGFFGVSLLICLFFFLIYRILLTSGNSKDLFGSYVAGGIIGLIVFQVYQNIGMTVGLMPITGLALPFISYGGSSLLATYICMGLVFSIGIGKKPSLFS